jgi:hypothetical protein
LKARIASSQFSPFTVFSVLVFRMPWHPHGAISQKKSTEYSKRLSKRGYTYKNPPGSLFDQ